MDSSAEQLAAQIGKLLMRVMSSSASRATNKFVSLDLSSAQVRILLTLARHPEPVAISDIACDAELSLVQAGRGVDRLFGAGFVDRREDARDRRVKRVSLTPQGLELVEHQTNVHRESLRALVAPLRPAEREALIIALAPLLDSAQVEKGNN